jgi:hypothetical protein
MSNLHDPSEIVEHMPTKDSSGCSLEEQAQGADPEIYALAEMVNLFEAIPNTLTRSRMLRYLNARFASHLTAA